MWTDVFAAFMNSWIACNGCPAAGRRLSLPPPPGITVEEFHWQLTGDSSALP